MSFFSASRPRSCAGKEDKELFERFNVCRVPKVCEFSRLLYTVLIESEVMPRMIRIMDCELSWNVIRCDVIGWIIAGRWLSRMEEGNQNNHF